MRHATHTWRLSSSLGLGACAFRPPEISYDDEPIQATQIPEPPRPVEIVEVPTPLPLPGQLQRIPPARRTPSRPIPPCASTRPTPPRACSPCARVHQRGAGLSVHARRALSGLHRARPGHRHHAAGGRDAGRQRPRRRRRHRALDHRRHRERHRPHAACTSSSSRRGPTSPPTSSSTPTAAPTCWSCARPSAPTWPRSPGSIRRTR